MYKNFLMNDEETRIFYYNIDYRCNNKCRFCFSHMNSDTTRDMDIYDIINGLERKKITKKDIIVINGGEPSIHPDFYEFIHKLSFFPARKVVYSNGVSIDTGRIEQGNVEFIIPIHGEKDTHDYLTQVKGSYENTIHTLQNMQKKGLKYSIKFIINKEMIGQKFDICGTLRREGLKPYAVYLARLNETKKSKALQYEAPEEENFKEYLNVQMEGLQGETIFLLDIPPCYLQEYTSKMSVPDEEVVKKMHIPKFYYNDNKRNMLEMDYWKERIRSTKCAGCEYNDICDLLNHSYYILGLDKNQYVLKLE